MAINNKLVPANFSQRVEFGSVTSETDPNTGVDMPVFQPKFSLYCFIYTVGMYLQLTTEMDMSKQKIIVIRHNPKVNLDLLVRLKGEQYEITKISPDESSQVIAYDYLTLQKVDDIDGLED